MLNRTEIYYFRIGSFVITGLALVILGIIILGSGRLLQKTIYVETYFDESVQGLSIGSPVKYRGLQIGYVKKIAFVNEIYSDRPKTANALYSRYLYVLTAITDPILTKSSGNGLEESVKNDVKDGLRFKLSLQGLTGTAYLELNYVDPKTSSVLPIDWRPENFYIPSAMSTLNLFSDNIQYVLDQLKQVNIARLFGSIQNLTDHSDQVMQKLNDFMMHSQQQARTTIDNIQAISNNLKVITDQAKISPSSVLWGSAPPRLKPENL